MDRCCPLAQLAVLKFDNFVGSVMPGFDFWALRFIVRCVPRREDVDAVKLHARRA